MDFKQICVGGDDPNTVGGLNRWCGRNHWLYLDNRKINGVPCPLVNIGLGCPIGLAEAITLPFEIMGQVATPENITADFAAVSRAPFNFRASGYEDFTVCRLPDEEVDALAHKRFDVLIVMLRHMFSEFDSWPETGKAGALDLFYAHGVAVALTYHSLVEALKVGDFIRAALYCKEDIAVPFFTDRNRARAKLFARAASV